MQVSELPTHYRIISKLQERGFSELTDIQSKTLLPALKGSNLIASSKTGSGKTLAFLIPCLHRMLSQKALTKKDPRALILAPTRELAKQVFQETKRMSAGTAIKVQLVTGGENFNQQMKALMRNPTIIVGTPGRIHDHLSHRHIFLHGLELLIMDEADRMFDLGFAYALGAIHEAANHRKRQTLLFSATLDTHGLSELTQRMVPAAVRINIDLSTSKHDDISQTLYFCDGVTHKNQLLETLLRTHSFDQAIVFTATRADTERLTEALNDVFSEKNYALALSGDLNQQKRSAAMSAFSRGQYSVLVTTDLGSRGLDMPKVGMVVNYDMPKHAEEYVHRIGRTGRAGNKGVSFSLVGKNDWLSFTSLKAHLNYEISCVNHPDLPAKFSGVKSKPKVSNKKTLDGKTKTNHKKNSQSPSEVKNTKKRQSTSATLVEAGAMPIKRKKKNTT